MQIDTERVGDTLVVRLRGELDLHTAPEFRASVEREFSRSTRLKHLLLVLSGVPFIDSSGIGAILGRYKALHPTGGKVVAAAPQPQVRKALAFAGVDRVIPILEDERDALASVR